MTDCRFHVNSDSISTLLFLAFSAIVTAFAIGCSSGGVTPPDGGDNPAGLTLLYCRVTEVSGEMHVQWRANRPTTGEFRYGVGSFTQLQRYNIPADSHDAVLLGLDFDTQYNYGLTVTDSLGNVEACTGTFRTPIKATPEPMISGLEITDVTERTAHVSWRTDEPATTILYYGVGETSDSILSGTFTQEHAIDLAGLTPSSIYTVRPEAVDIDNLRGIGAEANFATEEIMILWFPDLTLALGDTGEVQVYLEGAEDLAALQYTLTFAEGHLEILSLEERAFYTDNNGFAFFRAIRNAHGEVSNHLTWTIEFEGNTPVGTDADGSGTLAGVIVRAIEPGEVTASFASDSTFGLDMFANQRACSLRVGSIVVQP